jgi:hypothetical protein
MPRQSAAAQSFAANGSTRSLILPPPDLNELERAEFVSLVLGAPPNHFLPSDLPLLAAYSKAIVAERVASGELDRAPVIDDKPYDLRYPELLATPVVPTQASTASLLCNTSPRPKMLERCRL